MTSSIFWYDFETTGISPRCDRPLQVAGIRTNEALEEIGEPLNIYCRPSDDILPHPAACLQPPLHWCLRLQQPREKRSVGRAAHPTWLRGHLVRYVRCVRYIRCQPAPYLPIRKPRFHVYDGPTYLSKAPNTKSCFSPTYLSEWHVKPQALLRDCV